MTARPTPKKRLGRPSKVGKTRDAAAVFLALRPYLGYTRGLEVVEAAFGVPERNIRREIDQRTSLLPGPGLPDDFIKAEFLAAERAFAAGWGVPCAVEEPGEYSAAHQTLTAALFGIAANLNLVQANIREKAIDVSNWPEPLRIAATTTKRRPQLPVAVGSQLALF